VITQSQNWPLRGLYWLSKDLIENESEFSKSILPEAQQIAKIRNFMEHKSFKILDMGETAIVDNDLTYQIQRHELEQKVYILIQMARSAIINLSFAIHLEEMKKEKKPSMPVSFFKLDDDYKT
jgi:LA2681-like HEPN